MHISNKKPQQNNSWVPVLSYKRLYDEPKFILSLERKKARIISGIRDRQVDDCEKKIVGMTGGKIRNKTYKTHAKVHQNSKFNAESFVETN